MNKNEKGKKVLLVEDNYSHVCLIQEIWQDLAPSHQLLIVKDGCEAIAYLHQQGDYVNVIHPDLILLDLNLPKKDGREVLKEIKSDPKIKQIPVIILTTSTNEEDIIQSYNLNANCYITKPRNLRDLFKVMGKIVDFWLETVTFYPE